MSEYNVPTVTMEEALNPEGAKQKNWSKFVEDEVVAFFDAHELDKMNIEDNTGNKAKLVRTKNNEIKIEYTTSIVL